MAHSSNIVIEQVINYILNTGNFDFIKNNGLTEEYFPGYENEYNFIVDHYNQYHKVPDKITFADIFEDFNFFNVNETESYLYKELYDLRYYNYVADAWEDVKDLVSENPQESMAKFRLMMDNAPKYLSTQGIDIISQAKQRYELIKQRATDEKGFSIKTGFDELDTVIDGWNRGEELGVIFGRTGAGKSFVMLKSLVEAFKLGYKVGFISPEMSVDKVGFRFDTLYKQFENKSLNNVSIYQNDIMFKEYENYINNLQTQSNKFIVATLQDFDKKITVSKLKSFILQNELDIVGIDGITYMSDERRRKGDNKTTTLTNISEDLMTLSNEVKVPIIVAVQSNRGGVRTEEEDGAPELENIRDSDGIAQNATKVISIRQRQDRLDLVVKKNRDGKIGDTFSYYFDPNKGIFEFYNVDKEVKSYGTNDTTKQKKYVINNTSEEEYKPKKKVREF